jgi:histidine triad (HIT) family protein
MNVCVFCEIVAGKRPAAKVYEDGHFLAFLDSRPRSPGHTLIVPKKHERWVWDVEPQAEYWLLARRIARAQQNAFHSEAVWCTVMGDESPMPTSGFILIPQQKAVEQTSPQTP